MAGLPGSGETPGVATSDQWVDEARMGFPLAIKRTEGLRPVSGVLGVPHTSGIFTLYSFFDLRRLARLVVGYSLSCPEYLSGSPPADRLAGQVRGDGD